MGRRRFVFREGGKGVRYLRVSSSGQVETEFDNEGLSIPAQRRKCIERERQQGLEVVEEFIDPGLSATSTEKRKHYQAMLKALRDNPELSFVMVYSTSRSHRFWPDGGIFVNTLLQLASIIRDLGGAVVDVGVVGSGMFARG